MNEAKKETSLNGLIIHAKIPGRRLCDVCRSGVRKCTARYGIASTYCLCCVCVCVYVCVEKREGGRLITR